MKQFVITDKITVYSENSFNAYMREINKIPLMTPDEEYKVAMEAKNGNTKAMEYLVMANLRFVISVAKQYTDKDNKIEDLINEGNIGLVIAAQRFDPTKGFKFISYAVWWIRRGIQEYKNTVNTVIRKPSNRVIVLHKYKDVKSNLEVILEREPTKEEVITAMGEIKEFDNLNWIAELEHQDVYSLDLELGDDGFSLKDTICSVSDSEIKENVEEIKFKLSVLLNKLKPREKTIIQMVFGLNGYTPMTLQEIGAELEITREAVRQIKNKSLFKLKIHATRMNLNFNEIM